MDYKSKLFVRMAFAFPCGNATPTERSCADNYPSVASVMMLYSLLTHANQPQLSA
jgi:hypothetical protein